MCMALGYPTQFVSYSFYRLLAKTTMARREAKIDNRYGQVLLALWNEDVT